jgi:2-oxoisovalerate dehydrogenase E1 component
VITNGGCEEEDLAKAKPSPGGAPSARHGACVPFRRDAGSRRARSVDEDRPRRPQALARPALAAISPASRAQPAARTASCGSVVALDQLINQAANVRYLSRGRQSAPILVRCQQGVTPGSCAQHSQSLEALLAHIPGLRVGMASNPADAYAMTRAAIAHPDPVVLIESRALYGRRGPVDLEAPVEGVGGARLHRGGDDLVIISWGRMVDAALAAADRLAADGIQASVLDLRWLSPLDDEAIAEAVSRCNRVLICHEANVTGGFGAEVAARIASEHLYELDAPVRRVGSPDVRYPSAPVLQEALLPGPDDVVAAAREVLAQ